MSKSPVQKPLPLSTITLGQLDPAVSRPTYNRSAAANRIVHMSLGGFHRSHHARYVDALLTQQNEADTSQDQTWMITGVGLLQADQDKIEALRQQDCLYSLLERSATNETLRIIGSINTLLFAPSEMQKLLDELTDPATKIVSLTITEKGYCYNELGDLDTTNKAVQADIADMTTPSTALGLIIAALQYRRENTVAPFTVMSCDNLPHNGDLCKKLVLQMAGFVDKALKEWIADNVSFPNSMVDRITPATTPDVQKHIAQTYMVEDSHPVVSEDFSQWVLEDSFCNERPRYEDVGVQIVADVEPYEKMKVRLLNGSHSALAYMSYLMGYRKVDAAMSDPLMYSFLEAYMDHDITPTLDDVEGVSLTEYKQTLLTRFSNPAISDQVQRLAADGSNKIQNAILPCLRHQLRNDASIRFISFALACWFVYMTGTDEQGEPIAIHDPYAEKFHAISEAGNIDVVNILQISEIFGDDLRHSTRLISQVEEDLALLDKLGTKEALRHILRSQNQ